MEKKKKYQKPQTEVINLNMESALLTGQDSGGTYNKAKMGENSSEIVSESKSNSIWSSMDLN